MAQQNGSTKRKVDARNSVPNAGNNSTARKRARQNAAMSAEQTSREPSSTPRQSSENIPYTPTSDNTYLPPPATYAAVTSLAATSSGRPSALPSPRSRCVSDDTPHSTNSPTSTFVAVNQVQTSVSTGADGCNTTSTHTAPSLSDGREAREKTWRHKELPGVTWSNPACGPSHDHPPRKFFPEQCYRSAAIVADWSFRSAPYYGPHY
jgi:hypothetical protein